MFVMGGSVITIFKIEDCDIFIFSRHCLSVLSTVTTAED